MDSLLGICRISFEIPSLATVSTATLPNDTFATATLRATYQSGFTYFRGQEKYWNSQTDSWEFDMCDFVDDYRSSTVFDAIGSIGGLFALLQAVHVLLFGRPLFWGLTGRLFFLCCARISRSLKCLFIGAKLISPFGILGAFSSKGFKRRLHEQYHYQPSEHEPESIRIKEFLRDFVVDFGPADIDHHPPKVPGDVDANGTHGAHVQANVP